MHTLYLKTFRVLLLSLLLTSITPSHGFSQCAITRIIEVDPSCGLSNGALTIIADGIPPIEYSIDNGANWSTSGVFENLPGGDYLVRIRDGANCFEVQSPQLGDSGFHTMDITVDQCKDDGIFSFADLQIFNGREPLVYNWNGPNGFVSSDQDPGPLESGIYDLTVTDGGGCDIDTTFEIEKCCLLQTTCPSPNEILLTCASELPSIDMAFTDMISTNNGDLIAIEGIGFLVGPRTPCTDVIVTAQDSIGDATDCALDTVKVFRIYQITDGIDTTNCVQIFNIFDDVAPTISDVGMDEIFSCGQTPVFSTPNSNDNCGTSMLEFVDQITGTSCYGDIITRVWTVEDECGNMSSASQTIEIQDTEQPVINDVAGDMIVPCGATITFSNPSTADNCSNNVDLKFTDVDEGMNCAGMITRRIWTATDECGNVSTASQLLEFIDDESPMISGVGMDGTFACGETPQFSDPVATDECSTIVDLEFEDMASGNGCENTGIVRVWTATDECGNTSTASQSFSITGLTNPQITAEAETVNLNCAAISDVQADFQSWLQSNGNAVAEGCGVLAWTTIPDNPEFIPECGIQGEIMVTFIVTDQCGNTSATQGSFVVRDDEKPDLFCPADLVIDIGDPTAQQQVNDWLASVSSSDNCSTIDLRDDYNPLNFNFDCGPVGTTEISWRSEDLCGNVSTCSANITLNGTVTTIINCPVPLTLECSDPLKEDKIQTWLTEATAQDIDGSGLTVTNNYTTAEYTECTSITEITFFAQDECGVDITCKSDIILIDTQNPTMNCPTVLILQSNDSNNFDLINNWLAQAAGSDDCSMVTVTNDYLPANIDLDCGASGTYTINFTGLDGCGNMDFCEGIIEVIGVSSLNLICPVDLILECGDPNNDAFISEWLNTAEALDDNGANVSVSNDFVNQLTADCVSEQIVNFESLDECGIAVTCEAQIIVQDNGLPIINSSANLELQIEEYTEETITAWLSSFGASDECTSANIENDFDLNTLFDACNSLLPVNFTAVDECGNLANHTASLTIIDTSNPELSCPSQIVVACEEGNVLEAINEQLDLVRYSDNGGHVDFYNDFDQAALDVIDCSKTESIDINVEAVDLCGNLTTCQINVIVKPELKVFFPTVFSPNGDGVNDEFMPYGNNYAAEILKFEIYDRLGNKVYVGNESRMEDAQDVAWNGMYGSRTASIGVYAYFGIIMDGDGNLNEFKGNVTIIK